MDDLYNNLKIYETEVNVAFVSSNNSGSSHQAYGSNSANTDRMSDAVIYSFFANQSNSPQLNDEDLQQIDANDLEEMDLKWSFCKGVHDSKREQEQRTCKEECDSGNNRDKSFGSSSSDSEVSTCSKACLKSYETLKEHYDNLTKDFNKSQLNVGAYKAGLESVEARLDMYKENEVVFEEDIKIVKLDIKLRDNALTELRKKIEKENERYKTSEEYHAVPPSYTGNFIPPKYDLILADEGEYVSSESVTNIPDAATSKAKTSVSKPKFVGEPLIEDWISDSEDENETEFKESAKKIENKKQAKYPRKNSQSPRASVMTCGQCYNHLEVKYCGVCMRKAMVEKTDMEQLKEGQSSKFSKNDSTLHHK
ncbi:hypothetical protein Tco_1468518 [Tanacetum coccineum]